MIRSIALSVGLALSLAGSASGSLDQAPGCPPTLANQLADTGSATQLITVVSQRSSSTRGSLQLWRKSGECWSAVTEAWPAWLGQRGVSERKREGDRRTPAGAFGLGRIVYGVGPNPGVRYRYTRIVCGDWWVEDPRSRYYNQFRRVGCGVRPPFSTTSDDLAASPTAYRHFAFIRYNVDPVIPGRGSGIFLHASTGRPTLGCVSLPISQLVRTLRWLRPASEPLIVIGTQARIRSY